MPTFGRKPSGNDLGYGESYAGTARASIMGRPSANAWLYLYGGRIGRNTDYTPDVKFAHYATSGGTTVTDKLGESAVVKPSVYMADSWSGADYTSKPTAPAKVYSAYDYALSYITLVASVAHGQDNSGHVMHQNDGEAALPNPFGSTNTRPEGKMSLWAELQNNRVPHTPSNLSPAAESLITDSTPTIGADFRDDDEVLPGFSLGQADKVKKYRVEVWNATGSTRLQDSGVLTATSSQQTARRVTWTAAPLNAGTYIAKVTVWDQFDTPSQTAQWSFQINAGGVFTSVDIGSSGAEHYVGDGITNRTNAIISGYWSHSSGLSTSSVAFCVADANGVIVRGPGADVAASLSPGTEYARWMSDVGLSALTPGQSYKVGMQAVDTGGLRSPWAFGPLFLVNATPNTPTSLTPSGTAHSERPELSATLADPNDSTASLGSGFYIRAQGTTGDGTYVPDERRRYSNGKHYAQPSSAEMPGYGIYEWRARAADPWGLVGAYSAWQTITYAAPPVVTITAPVNGATITTGQPEIAWTIDKAQSTIAYTLREAATGYVAREYGPVASTTVRSVVPPAGILRNATEYEVELTLVTSDGLTGTAISRFTVQYPAPVALTNLRAEPFAGPFEPAADPAQWSRTVLSWDQAPLIEAPEGDFGGYLIARVNLATGTRELLGHHLARTETVFIDRTQTSGVPYQYEVTYLAERNEIDWVESVAATVKASVTLVQSVICSLDEDDLGAPLRYWKDRKPKPIRDWEIVPSFGPEPVAFQGAADYRVLRGSFRVLDDPYGTFTARDLLAAVEAMGAPRYREGEDKPAPRIICYRDLYRTLFVVINDTDPEDRHNPTVGEIDLEMTQVNARQGMEGA